MTGVSEPDTMMLVARAGPEITGRLRAIVIVVVVGVTSGIIALTCGGYWLSNFTQAYCMALAVLGCALLYGQLGLVSLSQWALVGVGGWVSLRVYHYIHPPFFVTMLAGGIGASVIGMIWGAGSIWRW
jgi:branched-chain amino acid transport system permease protein